MRTGHCYCGDIQYALPDAFTSPILCHCSMCRGTTGAPCVAWLTVPLAQFRVMQGSPTAFRSSAHATRTFCARCGTQLTFANDDSPDEIDVTICSLDAPGDVAPLGHVYAGDAMPWLHLADDLPRYQAGSTEA